MGAGGLAPRWRFPLLVLGFVALASGIAGGLTRSGLASFPAPQASVALHGALMVSAFFGTVISLERAVALGRLWGYGAPLASGLGGIALLAGATAAGLWLLAASAANRQGAAFYLERGLLREGRTRHHRDGSGWQ